MSTYRMLEDHWVNNQYLVAGTVQTTADVGGLLPANWIPTPNVDPLDTPAVNAFYAVGPVRPVTPIATPVTYWTLLATQSDFDPADFSPADFFTFSQSNSWVLTGLGANIAVYPKVNI